MTKLLEASAQLVLLNDKLALQRVAVTDKTTACEALLAEISSYTALAEDKRNLAVERGREIEEQSKVIRVEKVGKLFHDSLIMV